LKAKSTTIIIAINCLALAASAAFIIWRSLVERFLGSDVFKLTYEFLVISVVGGWLSAIYKGIHHDRDQRAAERTLQRQLLADIVKAYNAAKKARRLLRAKAIKLEPTPHVDRDPYDEQTQDLMGAQLDFESFVARVGESQKLFLGVEPDLSRIEKYLHDILDEYSTNLPKFSGSPPTLPLTSKSPLEEFTKKYIPDSAFDTELKRPFARITTALQTLITK